MVFRYPGGKAKAAKQLIQYSPPHFKEYREPFVGGGGVFWQLIQTVRASQRLREEFGVRYLFNELFWP